jgi:hypothetical protein
LNSSNAATLQLNKSLKYQSVMCFFMPARPGMKKCRIEDSARRQLEQEVSAEKMVSVAFPGNFSRQIKTRADDMVDKEENGRDQLWP